MSALFDSQKYLDDNKLEYKCKKTYLEWFFEY